MLNKSTIFDTDRINVINRVSLHRLSADDYYDMLVTEVREDTARLIFREITQLIDLYLREDKK